MDDIIVLTYIGRLDAYHKGLDLLVSAVSFVHKELEDHDVEINIYGPDICGRYAYLESLIKEHGVNDIISLAHEITGEDKESVLMNTDIFIQTSRFEGMPMGILEAMSYGIPCILTEGTTMASIVEEADAGWNAGSSTREIGDAIIRAIQQKESWFEKGNNARKLIRDEYSWHNITDHTMEIYKEVIKGL